MKPALYNSFVSFRFRFAGGNKNIIQKKREQKKLCPIIVEEIT